MITSLRIRNFKCFEDQRFQLSNLTLLIGSNGTGKSSVIQSLLLLRQSYQQRFLQGGRLLLNGDLIELGTAQDVFFENGRIDEFGFNLDFSSLQQQQVEWRFEYKKTETDVGSQISGQVSEKVYNTSLFGDNFHYLPADRIGPQSGFASSTYAVGERGQLGVKGEYVAHFLSLFGREKSLDKTDQRCHLDASSFNLIHQVEAWMREISPGVGIALENYQNIDRVDLRYFFGEGGAGRSNNYRSINVGFGITYTLPIVVALLASENDTLVLLENPEAHLHPGGQVKLGELMARAASCGVQIIVETHSDYIRQGIRNAMPNYLNIIPSDKIREHSLRRVPGQLVSECAPLDQNFFPDHGL